MHRKGNFKGYFRCLFFVSPFLIIVANQTKKLDTVKKWQFG